MEQLLRWFLKLLGIVKSEKTDNEDESLPSGDWKARLSTLRQDEYEHSKKLNDCDTARELLEKKLEEAEAAGEKDFKLDRLRHQYEEAKAAFDATRRKVDSLRTSISRLAELVRMREERLAAGSVVEAEQYHQEARELYAAIQRQREQLREIEISSSVLAEMRDPASEGGRVSAEEFDLGSDEVAKDRGQEVE